MQPFILITIPHATCSFLQQCDGSAIRCADDLKDLLKEVPTIDLFGYIPRDEMDLNRKESEPSFFQRRLTNFLEDPRPKIVIDVHSAHIQESYGAPAEASILIMARNNPEAQALVQYWRNDPRVFIIPAFDRDFIVEKAERYNVPAILIEFQEGKNNGANVALIAQGILDYIHKTFT